MTSGAKRVSSQTINFPGKFLDNVLEPTMTVSAEFQQLDDRSTSGGWESISTIRVSQRTS
jgi:hypothetical protein